MDSRDILVPLGRRLCSTCPDLGHFGAVLIVPLMEYDDQQLTINNQNGLLLSLDRPRRGVWLFGSRARYSSSGLRVDFLESI
jgi:hypothetical protein